MLHLHFTHSRLLYEATRPKDYTPALPPISVDSKFDILFDHRWWLFCQMHDVAFIPMTPHLINFQIGYSGPVVYRQRFDNMFCLPPNSPKYLSLSQQEKEVFTHNLLYLYEVVYMTLQNNPTPMVWNKVINAIAERTTVINRHTT